MAKKTRKQKQRTAARRPGGAAPAQPVAAGAGRPASGSVNRMGSGAGTDVMTSAAAATAVPARTGEPLGSDATRRRVGRVGPVPAPTAAAGRGSRATVKASRFGTAAAMVEPLDSDDPAIPFDRVPYVPADLRRVATIAALMIILILIAWAIVTKYVS
jgi:hypothetical protein